MFKKNLKGVKVTKHQFYGQWLLQNKYLGFDVKHFKVTTAHRVIFS